MPFDLRETDRLLTTTRAVRKRLDLERPVEPEVIRECLAIALQAANASNEQNWAWIVVTDPEKRRAIGELYRAYGAEFLANSEKEATERGDADGARVQGSAAYLAEHLGEAPALVIACAKGTLPEGAPPAMVSSVYGSIYPAVWNFQLALRSRGLGSVLTTLHLLFADKVAELLGIPDDYTQVCMIPIGYTRGHDFLPAKRRPLEEVTHWDNWGQTPA